MNKNILNYAMNYEQMSESERKQKLFELKNMYGEAALKEVMYDIKNTYDISVSEEKPKKSSNDEAMNDSKKFRKK